MLHGLDDLNREITDRLRPSNIHNKRYIWTKHIYHERAVTLDLLWTQIVRITDHKLLLVREKGK